MPKESQGDGEKKPKPKRMPLTVTGLILALGSAMALVKAFIFPVWKSCLSTLPASLAGPLTALGVMVFLGALTAFGLYIASRSTDA